ncbi:MAG: hypothetical protein U0821_09965 [Chloroflexota bacterium]
MTPHGNNDQSSPLVIISRAGPTQLPRTVSHVRSERLRVFLVRLLPLAIVAVALLVRLWALDLVPLEERQVRALLLARTVSRSWGPESLTVALPALLGGMIQAIDTRIEWWVATLGALDALAVGVTYFAARTVLPLGMSAAAALLYALAPTAWYASRDVDQASLPVLSSVALLAILRWSRSRKLAWGVLAATTAGLAANASVAGVGSVVAMLLGFALGRMRPWTLTTLGVVAIALGSPGWARQPVPEGFFGLAAVAGVASLAGATPSSLLVLVPASPLGLIQLAAGILTIVALAFPFALTSAGVEKPGEPAPTPWVVCVLAAGAILLASAVYPPSWFSPTQLAAVALPAGAVAVALGMDAVSRAALPRATALAGSAITVLLLANGLSVASAITQAEAGSLAANAQPASTPRFWGSIAEPAVLAAATSVSGRVYLVGPAAQTGAAALALQALVPTLPAAAALPDSVVLLPLEGSVTYVITPDAEPLSPLVRAPVTFAVVPAGGGDRAYRVVTFQAQTLDRWLAGAPAGPVARYAGGATLHGYTLRRPLNRASATLDLYWSLPNGGSATEVRIGESRETVCSSSIRAPLPTLGEDAPRVLLLQRFILPAALGTDRPWVALHDGQRCLAPPD